MNSAAAAAIGTGNGQAHGPTTVPHTTLAIPGALGISNHNADNRIESCPPVQMVLLRSKRIMERGLLLVQR